MHMVNCNSEKGGEEIYGSKPVLPYQTSQRQSCSTGKAEKWNEVAREQLKPQSNA